MGIRCDCLDGICTLTIDRPEKRNALNLVMYQALADGIRQADQDNVVRVILITGGPDCFTSGNDLADFVADPPTDQNSPVMQFISAISLARKPIVAAVNGSAVGIGVTMLLHCDLVYAGVGASFQMPFVNLGLCPEAGSTLLLPRIMGHQQAAELLLLGEKFSAEKACRIGIVTAVCPDQDVLTTAHGRALQLASQPAAAVRLTKSLLKRASADELQKAIDEEGRQFLQRLDSPEAVEAMQAFMERRKPDFSRFI